MSEEPSPQSRQETIDAQKAKFLAKGGKIIKVLVMESGEIIKGLKAKQKTRTVEEWHSGDIRRLKERKKK